MVCGEERVRKVCARFMDARPSVGKRRENPRSTGNDRGKRKTATEDQAIKIVPLIKYLPSRTRKSGKVRRSTSSSISRRSPVEPASRTLSVCEQRHQVPLGRMKEVGDEA